MKSVETRGKMKRTILMKTTIMMSRGNLHSAHMMRICQSSSTTAFCECFCLFVFLSFWLSYGEKEDDFNDDANDDDFEDDHDEEER